MPSSSLTGMNAPDRPPTWEVAIRPPFLTASLRSARAAVVPGAPHASSPISSKMRATLSPTSEVGARERSMMPNGTPRRRDASRATSCPTRVILNAVRLIVSAISVKSAPFRSSRACLTTPGPLTPTLMTRSPSATPWNAPAMKGLSPGALQNTTILAQPRASCSRVSSAVRLITSPISRTASILMPAFVEPMLTDEQTISVAAIACGMESMSTRSPCVIPFSTSAENPPMKLTPTALPARSSASATGTKESVWHASAAIPMGVTEIRLLMMGMPYSVSMSSPV